MTLSAFRQICFGFSNYRPQASSKLDDMIINPKNTFVFLFLIFQNRYLNVSQKYHNITLHQLSNTVPFCKATQKKFHYDLIFHFIHSSISGLPKPAQSDHGRYCLGSLIPQKIIGIT